MQYHILKVFSQDAMFLYTRVTDQPVHIYDWERSRWVEATDQEGYQPRFRVPLCPERINYEQALSYTLAAHDKASPRDGYMLILTSYMTPLEEGIRIGFALSPVPFEGQKVQAGQGAA